MVLLTNLTTTHTDQKDSNSTEKVVLTDYIANVIAGIKAEEKDNKCINDLDWLLWKTLDRVHAEHLKELEDGIVTLAKAIKYGYKRPVKYMTFMEAFKHMQEGKKVNRYNVNCYNGQQYTSPIYLCNYTGKFKWDGFFGASEHALEADDITSDKWFIVEE